MKKIFALFIFLIFISTGCQQSPVLKNNIKETKIGIITMTTGDLAFLGENIIHSAELAVADYKGDLNVKIVVEDVGSFDGESKNAVAAFKKMVDVDNVQYIINGISSNGTMAIAPLVDEKQVLVITPLTGGENIDKAAEYLFRNGPSDVIAGTKPADDLYNKFGYKNVALFTDNAEYTLDIKKHFKNEYKGTVVLDEIIQPDLVDYRVDLLKVKNSNADAIFINTATGGSAHYMIKQAGELGISLPIFANFLAYGPQLFSVAGKYAEGVYIYDPEFDAASVKTKDFFEKYRQAYGGEPVIPFHAVGTYDAVNMGLEAIEKAGYNGVAIHDYFLKNIQNWQGLNGTVSFDKLGNTQTGFLLKQIKNKVLVEVR